MLEVMPGAFCLQVPNSHDGRQAISLQSAHRSETSGVLLSCSAKNELRLFSFAGKQLASVDAAGLHNHMASISADGRFFAAATFTSDVKVRVVQHIACKSRLRHAHLVSGIV